METQPSSQPTQSSKQPSHLPLAIISVILSGLIFGLLGYWYGADVNSTPATTSSASPTATASSSPVAVASSSPSPAATASTRYFTITQWNVRSPYSGQDTYTYKLSNDNKFASIQSSNLVAKDSACGYGSVGRIERWAPADQVYAEDGSLLGVTAAQYAAKDPEDVRLVGGYYYMYIGPQSMCTLQATNDALELNANGEARSLVTNLQSTPN